MSNVEGALKRIEQRLIAIEAVLTKPAVNEALVKAMYSCAEISELSQVFGLKKYRPYTVRLACSDGRVPEADKRDDGAWTIPREAVLRILNEGLPPERRQQRSIA